MQHTEIETKRGKTILIRANELRPHPRAQRSINRARLLKLRKIFDLDAIGTLHAVEGVIDGVYGIWLVDGQHRWRLLLDEGFGEWEVEVFVHAIPAEDEARASDLFLKLNYRGVIGTWDRFDQSTKALHPDAVGVVNIVERLGLRIGEKNEDGVLACVAALSKVWNFDEGQSLRATLQTIIEAWGRQREALEGKIVEGVGIFYATYNGEVDRAALVRKLAKYPGGPSRLIGDGRGIQQYRKGALGRCVAERVLQTYNSGRREKLGPL